MQKNKEEETTNLIWMVLKMIAVALTINTRKNAPKEVKTQIPEKNSEKKVKMNF